MGIYPDHGVEYYFVLDSNVPQDTIKAVIEHIQTLYKFNLCLHTGNRLRILSTNKTDNRLEASKFFAQRKADWFGIKTCTSEWCVPIEEQSEVDIPLHDEEKKIIESVREQFKDQVIFEGWFDVNTICSTYHL